MSTVQSTLDLGEAALSRADGDERLSAEEILALYSMPADEVIAHHDPPTDRDDEYVAGFSGSCNDGRAHERVA